MIEHKLLNNSLGRWGEALRNSSTSSPSRKSNLALATDFRSRHCCTDTSDTVARNMPKPWEQSLVCWEPAWLGPGWALRSPNTAGALPLHPRSLQFEYGKISISGGQIPADTDELEAHIEGYSLRRKWEGTGAHERLWCPTAINTQPLSWKHKRSLRQVGIRHRYHRELPGSFWVSILEFKSKDRECSESPSRQCEEPALWTDLNRGIAAQSLVCLRLPTSWRIPPHSSGGLASFEQVSDLFWALRLGHGAQESHQASLGEQEGSFPLPTNSDCIKRKIQHLDGHHQTQTPGAISIR